MRKTHFWERHMPNSLIKMVESKFHVHGLGDWNVVNNGSDINMQQRLPDLIGGESEILSDEHRSCLIKMFPVREEENTWRLTYSTSKNGFSLKTLYRSLSDYDDSCLLAIEDTKGRIFGAFSPCSLKPSDHFYGTGETFVYTFHPEFLCFKWTGLNTYFIKGDIDSLCFGASDGNFGLWLNDDFSHGSTESCETFGNVRLTSPQDFVVKTLECWAFF